MGKYDEAAEIFARVEELIPEDDKDYEFLFHKGMILIGQGDTAQAREILMKAKNIPEPDAMGMKILEEIEEILGE
jgi:TolA-binding protein